MYLSGGLRASYGVSHMSKKTQLEIAERLQLKLLERFEKMLDDGTLQATDAATLSRLLMSNGWNIDPAKLPAGLAGILTKHYDATSLDADDPDMEGALVSQ